MVRRLRKSCTSFSQNFSTPREKSWHTRGGGAARGARASVGSLFVASVGPHSVANLVAQRYQAMAATHAEWYLATGDALTAMAQADLAHAFAKTFPHQSSLDMAPACT